jgi:hypothetical protein
VIRANKRRSAVVLAFFLASFSLFAQFGGEFTGYYAPSKWTTVLAGNAQYQNTASAERQQGNKLLLVSGAVSAQPTPQLPASIIDYTIALAGTGLQPVVFSCLFTGAADGYDLAQLIYDSGSGFQVIVNFSTLIGSQQAYIGQLQGGRPFGFRVYSNNDNVADTLVISVVPEPSVLSLLGLGVGTLLWRLRRLRG